MGVVAGRDEERAIRAEGEGAGVVAALAALLLEDEDHLLRARLERIARQGVARELLAGELRWRAQQIDPAVRREVGVECEAEQPVLLIREDGDLRDLDDLAAPGLPASETPGELDPENASVRRDRELHGPRHPLRENALFEAILARRRRVPHLRE